MSTVTQLDPAAKRDITVDWSTAMPGLTISSATVTAAGGLTVSAVLVTSPTTTFRVAGMVTGQEHKVTVHAVASNGEEDDHTVTIVGKDT